MTTVPGKLYLVATPIGNLNDISLRALETLRSVDVIACEDTRHSRKLLNAFEIAAKTISYHEHNELERSAELVKKIIAGASVAVVSDAGTPAVNDPGYRLVVECIAGGIDVVPIPGPVAFVAAAIVSGLPTDALYFGGFLPSKRTDRRRALESVRLLGSTLLFYESPHRLAAALADCIEILGDRRAAAIRELTKLHEEAVRGRLSEIAAHFAAVPPKGEFVLAIDRSGDDDPRPVAVSGELETLVTAYETAGLDRRSAMKKAARELGISRSEAYRLLQQ